MLPSSDMAQPPAPDERPSTAIDLKRLASTAPRPVQLYHALSLLPNRSLAVFSTAPIEVAPGIFVSAATPITITTTPTTRTELVPSIALDAGFVKGWNTLSDELKVMILRENVAPPHSVPQECHVCIDSKEPTHNNIIHTASKIGLSDSYNEIMKMQLFPFRRMTPEIATLANEIFYGTYTIRFMSVIPNGLSPALPSQLLDEHLIRRLDLHQLMPFYYRAVKAISQPDSSFTALRYVRVTFDWGFLLRIFDYSFNSRSQRDRRAPRAYVEQNCAGDIRFLCNGWAGLELTPEQRQMFSAPHTPKELAKKDCLDTFEHLIKTNITFHPPKKSEASRWN
jgi:hypothetical protein